MKLFESFNVKNLTLKNRIVMPPMCTYTADTDGMVKDRHLAHYAARAAGGTALIIVEATGVMPNGRINDHCLGIWDEGQIDGLRSLTDICHAEGALVALQLNHAGRKCTARPEDHDYTLAPSALAFDETYRIPREMTADDMEEVKAAFCEAARRAHAAGLDAIEIHAAHGFLLHSFLSSVTNKRRDGYGG
ncbi:MAG: NADPH dehydrogenase, partial [Clostridiaceae bacterium]|nr:NADPH dehydrogenase [Clostridiaceae bacterium]